MQPRICLIWTMLLAMAAAYCVGQTATAPDQQRQTALALEQQGDNVEAEAAWRAYLKAHPSSPEAYAHLGLLEARQGHYKEAEPLYRKALAQDPGMPALRFNLGLALFKAGDLKEAIPEFTLLLKGQAPSSPDAQRLTILIGMAHYGLREYAQAVPYLKSAAAADAQNLPLRLTLAHSCLWSKQYQCVLDTYHEILMLNAESAEADMLAGEALDEMKNRYGAIEQFRAAVKADPRMPDVHFGLGYLLWTQSQYPEAVSEFQAELDLNPNHAQALTYLGDCNLVLNHPEIGRPLLEKAIQMDPGIELAHLDLGVIDADAGRQDDALRELAAAEKLAPNDVNVHWRLGRFYQTTGRKDEAKIEFDKTRGLQKADNDAVVDKMGGAQAKGRSAQQPAAEPGK
ncbi:MAG: tetratricopeptide repeat protein [Terracidiphilus sp.]|jgi:tetratricopeptide (TPR) repeat protein